MKKTYIQPTLFSCAIEMKQHLLSASQGAVLREGDAIVTDGKLNNEVKFHTTTVDWENWE